MKILGLTINKTFDGFPLLNIMVDKVENKAIEKLLGIKGTDISKYEVIVQKKPIKRSLDANAYAWVLMSKLAKKLGTTKLEVYREYIKDTSAFKIIPVRADEVERFEEIWSSNGDGWICEVMGDCRRTEGHKNVRCYYGSSIYTTDEMTHLIDLIVADCKQQGIETMTPIELERMKASWRG